MWAKPLIKDSINRYSFLNILMMKQLFRFSILLLALLLPATATAYDFEVDGIYYNINGNEATVTDGGSYSNRYSGSVAIPATVTYNGTTYSVTSIGESAFSWCMGLTSIDIPNSVTTIGKCAFEYCMNLPSVVIPNSVTSIGESAFENCSGLTSINIPNLVTAICNGAFGGCRCLTSIVIPNSVTSIGESAFWGCEGLTSIVIPNSVTTIGNGAFGGCRCLTSVVIPNSVTSIGNRAFSGCYSLTSVVIPNSVTEIGESTFENCTGLTSIDIPNSVTSIGNNAFTWCSSLTSVVIPNSVTEIGDEAFSWCSGLTSIVVASENPRYDSRNNCNAIIETANNTLIVGCKNTIIPNSVTSIGNRAFFGSTGLTSIDIPNSVTSIGNEAFVYSGLTSINIPNSVTSIGGEAFYGTDWYYNQPDGLVYAGMVAYKYKGMMPNGTSITLKEGTLGIAGYAFVGCTGLTSIDIPNSVISIGETAFYQCTGLTSIVIPNSVTSIGYGVFSRCTGLASIVVASGNPRYDSRNNCNAIIETASNTLIVGCKNTIIPNSVTKIGDYAFFGCTGLTSIDIPNSVTSIGNEAFVYSGLTSINIPNSVTSIGGEAFYGTDWYYNQPDGLVYAGMVAYKYKGMMPNGTSITLKEGTLGIAGYAFVGCTGLTSIDIPNSVISIGETAFYQCTGLTSIVIPNSVTSIGYGVFSRCTGLASIVVASGNPRYDSRNNCNAIIETASNTLISGCYNTIIPNSVTSIGNKAFYGCYGLTSIVIPNLVTSIGESAFEYCSGLTDVYCYIADLSRVSSGDKHFSLGYGDCSGRTLHVLQGTADAYRADENWYPYFGQIVEDIFMGDVNGDLEVNIADVNAVIDIILGGNSSTTAADVNGDGEINIADINAVIDIILGGTLN